jgi:hypothetical protein
LDEFIRNIEELKVFEDVMEKMMTNLKSIIYENGEKVKIWRGKVYIVVRGKIKE